MLVVLVAIAAADALARFVAPESSLRRVSIVLVAGVVVFVAAQWGRTSGILVGLVAGAYALYYFFAFADEETPTSALPVGLVIGATLLGLGTLVGSLRSRADEAMQRALLAERERAADLAAGIRALEEANRDLTSLNEGLLSFAYVVSHDLKEPVRAMSAYLDEALQHAGKPETRAAVEAARASNERLAQLLLGVLEVARASRLDPADLRAVDPVETLHAPSCAARYHALLRERSAKLEASAAPGTPAALASPEHLAQALGHLVANAVLHSDKPAPRVRVRVAPTAGAMFVDIVVEDDGPGFAPRALEHLGRVSHGGAALPRGGFGLLVVRRAIERMHGTLALERSTELGGALVRLTLPAAPASPR